MGSIRPVTTGLVGLGGYARSINRLLLEERGQAGEDPSVQLAAVCSSSFARHAERVEELKAHGVKLCESFDDMLALDEIEAVWLPLPIDLHVPFTEKALAAGKAVMLEKPVAGCVQDVDQLIAARDKAKLPVAIGFQDVWDRVTMQVKKHLLDGAIGQVQSATLWACWPRAEAYYNRASWAGAMKKDGVWVMDSPANNALSHFINLTLFFLGPGLEDSANPTAVEAELYRSHAIENYDTISARLTVDDRVPFLVHLTHACRKGIDPRITIHGDKGIVKWVMNEGITISDKQGKTIYEGERSNRPHRFMADRFTKWVRGIEDDTIARSTLDNARPQIVAINGASEATTVTPLSEGQYEIVEHEESCFHAIPGIEEAFEEATDAGKMLHELGTLDWTRPPGRFDLKGYRAFGGPKM